MLGRAKPCLQAQGSDVAGWVGEEETKEAAELGGAEVQTLGDGRESPCISILISSLLEAFLYHLTCKSVCKKTIKNIYMYTVHTYKCSLIDSV